MAVDPKLRLCSPRGGPQQVLTRGHQNWRLFNPQGIAINAEGTVMWVANGGWDRIERFSLSVEKGACTVSARTAT